MPLIHHPLLRRELEVSETAAEILTTNPRVPWVRGPLSPKHHRPTATKTTPEAGDKSLTREED